MELLISAKKANGVFYVNLFVRFLTCRSRTVRGNVIAGNGRKNGKLFQLGKTLFAIRLLQVSVFLPSARSTRENRLLFQRNFYIYPSVKRKSRICFHSRILHVFSSRFSFFFFLSSSFDVPSSSSLLPKIFTREPNSASSLANSSRSRASFCTQASEVVYFATGSTSLPHASPVERRENERVPEGR